MHVYIWWDIYGVCKSAKLAKDGYIAWERCMAEMFIHLEDTLVIKLME